MSNSPLGGFTVVGGIVVIIILLVFIRSKVVTAVLGLMVLAYLLIHVKQIIPMVFAKPISSSALKGV